MANVKDYVSGQVLENIKHAFTVFESTAEPLEGTLIGDAMLQDVGRLKPRIISLHEAIEWIRASRTCAAGERVCRSLHRDTPFTESVFLDELAEAMAEAGKARLVSEEEASDTIRKYSQNPIVISKVSGKYSEICPTWVKRCLYWNLEKRGLICIQRRGYGCQDR